MIGLVTAYRSRAWTLPKISIPATADAAETASNEAIRQGGYLGLAEQEPLLTLVTSKGVETCYYALEIHGILDAWEANRTQSRKLVPIGKIEKYLRDRTALKAIRLLVAQRIDVKLLEAPKPASGNL
jgi:hypothetical protein